MSNLEKQIEETQELVHMMDKDIFTKTILQNQLVIMVELQKQNGIKKYGKKP